MTQVLKIMQGIIDDIPFEAVFQIAARSTKDNI